MSLPRITWPGPMPLWVAFAGACLGGAALVVLSLWSFYGYRESSDTTVDAAQIVLAEAGVYQGLLEAESAQRGYLLTGDEEFHAAFNTARERVNTRVATLQDRMRTTTEVEAMARMRPLIERKFADMQTSIDFAHAGDVEAATEHVASGTGKELSDQIIAEMVVIANVETSRHESALSAADSRSTLSLVAVSLLGIFVLAALLFLFRALRRRGVEEGLRRLNEEKDEFLGMVSHELRTPITVIMGNARVLRSKWHVLSGDSRLGALRDIEDHAERMHGVVANMLRLSRPDHELNVELEPVHVRRLVERSISRHRARYADPPVRLDTLGDVAPAIAHEEYLGQVVENLLSNAAKYGSPNEPIDVLMAQSDGTVTIAVMDRGPGIEKHRREAIFEPFVRLPSAEIGNEGLGLGLPICRMLMRIQGGGIAVSERPGGGSVFTVSVPVAEVSDDESAEPVSAPELASARSN